MAGSQAADAPTPQTLAVRIDGAVAWVTFNRPAQANSMSSAFWSEFPAVLGWLDRQPEVRVIILNGEGRHFCAGIDLELLEQFIVRVEGGGDGARGRDQTMREIMRLQDALSVVERVRVPVIAAIHGACLGGGVDLIAGCDLRYAAADAKFCIKEVDFGIVADVGTTQRLRHVIGLPKVMELSLTAETFDAAEAQRIGLVGGVYADREALLAGVTAIAKTIAAKPGLAVEGVKRSVLYSREHTVAEGLEHVAAWNAAHGFAKDTRAAVEAFRKGARRG